MESIQFHLEKVWMQLQKAKVAGAREIIEYIASLLLETKPFGFADNFKPRKPRTIYPVDDVILKSSLNEASKIIQQTHNLSSEMADAYLFDHYVLFYSSRLRKDTYPIPRHIVDFMLALLRIQPDHKIADFTCGSGGFLVNRDGNTTHHPGRTVGVEISQDWIRIAAANLALHGMKPPLTTLHADNTFRICAQELHHDTFDRIVMAPSFGADVDPKDTQWLVGSNGAQRSEALFILLILAKLNEGGKASIMVPTGIITRGSQNIRQTLIKDRMLRAVIKLQSGMLQPFNDEQVYILLLDKENTDRRELVWLFDVANDGYPLLRSRNLLAPPPEETRNLDDMPRVESVLSDARPLISINSLADMNISPLRVKRTPQIMVIAIHPAVTLKSFRFFPTDAQQMGHLLVELALINIRVIYIDIPLCESDSVQDIVYVSDLINWSANLYPMTQLDEVPLGRLLENRAGIQNQSFAVTYDGRILGIAVSSLTIQAENYELSMQNYELTTKAVDVLQPIISASAAELLNTVRINQRTVAYHIDNLLGHLEVPSIIGKPLPPVILKEVKDNKFVLINDLGTEQRTIWKFIQEHFIVDGKYALYFIPEQLEKAIMDKVHIQHTLYLLECMGLIMQVTLRLSDVEGISYLLSLCYRARSSAIRYTFGKQTIMRIKSLRIINHNILRDFTLEFTSSEKTSNQLHHELDLLVGVNGTGKSTVLRSLALIFQCLGEGKRTPAFGFDITYELTPLSGVPSEVSVRNIDLETQKTLPGGLIYWHTQNDSTNMNRAVEIANFPSDSIPPLTVAFTSGSDKGWLLEDVQVGPVDEGNVASRLPERDDPDLVSRLQDLFVYETLGGSVRPETISGTGMSEQRFLFISPDLIPLVVLCGLLNDMTRSSPSLQGVLHACQIKALRGFSIKLRMNNDLLHEDQKPFIRNLMNLAHHTVQTGSEYLLVFILKIAQDDMTRSVADAKALYPQQLLDGLAMDGLDMFQELVRLANPGGNLDPILRNVYLFLESDRKIPLDEETNERKKAALYLFDWLSDGEQSFLGRLYLFPLLSNQQSLILLDEPEVHFNDYWKRKLILTLNQTLQGLPSHIIMTTHSSITLSDVSEHDIKVLKRDTDNRSYATTPSLKTFGADPSDILVHIFGAEEAVGAHSVAFIRAQLAEIALMPINTVSDRQKRRDSLIKLRDILGPSYWRYLVRRELLEEENQQNVPLS